jgi:hypothetical protein
MAIFIAVVAVLNMGLGFALAVHLARQYRSLVGSVDDPCSDLPGHSDRLANLQSRVLHKEPGAT